MRRLRSREQEPRHAAPRSHILRVQAPLSPPASASFIQCMQLGFERWRGSLSGGGGGACRGTLAGSTRRQRRATAPIWDYEQREKIYNFTETPRRMSDFAVKTQSGGSGAFSGATCRRFGGPAAISGAFCSR